MPRQLSYRGMYNIRTWLDYHLFNKKLYILQHLYYELFKSMYNGSQTAG